MSLFYVFMLIIIPAAVSIVLFYQMARGYGKSELLQADLRPQVEEREPGVTPPHTKASLPKLILSSNYSNPDHISIAIKRVGKRPLFDLKVEIVDFDMIVVKGAPQVLSIGTLPSGRSCTILDAQISADTKRYDLTVMWRDGSFDAQVTFERSSSGRFNSDCVIINDYVDA